jgi:hypothetical protein
LCSCSGLP